MNKGTTTQREVTQARQARLPFPKEILFDDYRRDFVENEQGESSQNLAEAVRASGYPNTLYHQLRHIFIDQLDQTRVFVLTRDALEVVVATTERMRQRAGGGTAIILEPPTLPLWIEFEGTALRDHGADDDVGVIETHALWFTLPPGTTRIRDGSFETMRIAQFGHEAREAVIEWNGARQAWNMSIEAGCRHRQTRPNCSLCTLRNERSGVRGGVHLDQKHDAFAALSTGCLCYQDGEEWAFLIWVLLQMLKAEGAQHTIVQRHVRVRIKAKGERRTSRDKEEEREREAWNATHPVYVRIALNHRVHVRREGKGASGFSYSVDPEDGHLTNVVGHWRMLIPSPEKPWRGEQPRVVWVRGHERYVHGKRRVRYHVTP